MIELWIVKISIGIIFFNLFMASIRSFFNLNYSKNTLYCGIFGANLKPGANKKSALAKFKILGLYNISRGRDSSGVFINGEIKKNTKEFDNFIEEETLIPNFKGNSILGHNRAGSAGYKKTVDEAHPFLINESLIFTHNGTIRNVANLCKKYELKENDFNVDSKVLGTLLFTEGTDILSVYKGAAALAYTYLHEPDTLYLFHGKTREFKNGILQEERPLYCLETKDGVFYSSLEDSLKAIREFDTDEIYNLEYNTVFKIRNGEFLMDEAVKIDREDANVSFYYVEPEYDYTGFGHNVVHNSHSRHSSNFHNKHNLNSSIKDSYDLKLITKESYPIRFVEAAKNDFKIGSNKFIYFHFGRYWEAPRTLLNGPLYVKKGGIISSYQDKASELMFFFKGVLLKDRTAYNELEFLSKQIGSSNWVIRPELHNFALEMSKYSAYPVTSLPSEYNNTMSEYYRHVWYFNKQEKDCYSFTPRYGSGRFYDFKGGILVEIKTSQREKCVLNSREAVMNQFAELAAIKKNNSSTPGGSTILALPFQSGEISKIGDGNKIEESKENRNFWFFEKTYSNLIDILDDWKEDEEEAFKRYLRFAYIRDFSIVPTKKELIDCYDHILKSILTLGVSLGDYLNNEVKGDSEILLGFYNDVIDKKPDEYSNLDKAESNNSTIEIDEGEDDDSEYEKEQVTDAIENAIINLEDIQASAFELMNLEKSDLAQESAKVLLISTENTLSNLLQPLNKYKEVDLEKRVEKIRKTQNLKDGTI